MSLSLQKYDTFAIGLEIMANKQSCGVCWLGIRVGWRFYGIEWGGER